MGKRLETTLHETDNIVIVAMPGKGVVNIKSLQKSQVKLGIMPNFRPFFRLHPAARISFSK
jgi:hypothetical protein